MDTTQPTLTETERLKIKVLQLEGQLVDRTVQDWHAKTAQLKTELETTRPGWEFDTDTGGWKPR
jgi:ABC-type phosphate transport system auxiliary subunit